DPHGLAVGPQSHAAREGALDDSELTVGVAADDEELAGLVGGEGKADLLLGQPGAEMARAGDLDPGFGLDGAVRVGQGSLPRGRAVWASVRYTHSGPPAQPASNRTFVLRGRGSCAGLTSGPWAATLCSGVVRLPGSEVHRVLYRVPLLFTPQPEGGFTVTSP